MNLDDFRCMRRGQHLSTVSADNAALMRGIDWRNGKKNKALLMLHGFSSTPAVFRYMIPHIKGYDAIIAPPLPGHAVSLKAFSKLKADDLIPFVDRVCGSLCEEYEQVDILGLSLGSVLACHLSQRFPLHHLFLLSPALDIHLAINKTIALAQSLRKLGFRYIRSIGGNLHTSAHCEISLRLLPLSTTIEILTMLGQFPFTLPTCPTDVFLGCHDEVVSSHCVSARFANHKHINIHWLKNSAHVLPLDGDVDVILQCIKENNAITPVAEPA